MSWNVNKTIRGLSLILESVTECQNHVVEFVVMPGVVWIRGQCGF